MCSRYDPGVRNAYLLSVKHTHLQGIDGRSQMESGFPRNIYTSAHVWGQVLMCEGKSCSHVRSFTTWLYEHEAIKERIMHLRAERSPKVQVKILPREQASSASKETMIAALRQRIQKLEQENRDLKRLVEVAYGLLQKPAEEKRS